MLNRRILRAKAMQHIYAYKQCQRSNYELAFEHVHQAFQPDLNSMEVQDKEKLAKDEAQATSLLKAYFNKQASPEGATPRMEQVIKEAIQQYENQCRRDRQYLLQQMLASTEQIADHYVMLLFLLVALAEESGTDRPKKNLVSGMAAPSSPPKLNFYNNRVVNAIRQNDQLYTEAKNKNLYWNAYREDVKQWYRNYMKTDEKFLAYQQEAQPTLEQDVEIARHVFNNIILKYEIITAIAEENDINWTENKKAIKSMANKSIKSLTPENPDELEVVSLTPNWAEDREFMEELYNATIQHDEEYDHIIAEKAKNWSSDRIAHLDSIIIKMAITEMVNFSSIPVKVTINEYIDISKQYSTHKSKQFINGMLDVIVNDLQSKNLIRKSGRGLIDNQ